MPTIEELKRKQSPENKLMESVMPEIRDTPTDEGEVKRREMERIKGIVVECIELSESYRDKFKPVWDEIEQQIRQDPPPEWEKKEDWQSKIYIGLQAKTSESAYSSMSAMLFPTDRFYEVRGVERRDREIESSLEDLICVILNRGGFYQEKDFALQEASDIGTSFMKIITRQDKSGVDFVWRSAYQCLVDPNCGHDWRRQKWWGDQYRKDIYFLMEEIRRGSQTINGANGSLYDTDQLKAAIKGIEAMASAYQEKELETVRSIDGTGTITIPKGYKEVTLNEMWILLPMPIDPNDETKGYSLQHKLVTMVNKDFIIRVDDNAFGFIPAIPLKVKPRKYDYYGLGYLINGRGIQDLTNSMVNLGFDSQKITAMDIIAVDEAGIADSTSIQYRPLAVWKMKGRPSDSLMLTRHSAGNSAMPDILNGVTLCDRMHQDVTGVTRHAEGSPTVDGKEGDSTLGEYQLKLQAVDKRFLSVARRVEQDFIKSLIETIFRVISNPNLFIQDAATRMLGEVDIKVPDPMTGMDMVIGKRPKLLLEPIQKQDLTFDFVGVGVSQFSERQKSLERLLKALQIALSNPTLTAMTNLDILWKRLFQLSEIPDWEEIVKDKQQMQEMMQYIQALAGSMPMDGGQPGVPANMPSKAA